MRLLATLLLVAVAGCSGGSGDADADAGSGGTGGTGGDAGASGSAGTAGVPSVPGDTCDGFEPCGGELDGTWLVRSACMNRAGEDIAPIVTTCPTSAAAGMTLDAGGSYEFSSGILVVDFDVTATVTVAFTAACARSHDTDLESLCDEYGATQAADPQFSSTDCGVQDGECRCTLVGDPVHQSSVLSYEVMGTTIVDASGDETDFCVDGVNLRTRYFDAGDEVTISLERE